jgi:hypothetical protein
MPHHASPAPDQCMERGQPEADRRPRPLTYDDAEIAGARTTPSSDSTN